MNFFYLAPANCLQYLTKTAGSIESFNFKQEYGGSVRQLADQNYNICFKRPSVGIPSLTLMNRVNKYLIHRDFNRVTAESALRLVKPLRMFQVFF